MLRNLTTLLLAVSLFACTSAQVEGEEVALVSNESALTSEMGPVLEAINACRKSGTVAGRYVEPSAAQFASMEKAMGKFIATGKVTTPSGFSKKQLTKSLVLFCQSTNKGAGAYLLRTGEATDAIIEVPHSFYDVGTLDVGMEMFARMNARAMFVSTVHRYKGANCVDKGLDEEDNGCKSDAAHSKTHLFQAAHKGMLEADSSLLVYAAHGFAPRKGNPDAIVSHANTSACWTGVVDSLNENLPSFLAFEYGQDIHELGGTRGIQARQLQDIGGRMMHIELSKKLRTAIKDDAETAKGFVQSVAQGLSGERCGH
jgi:hypothetical protein